MVSEKVTIVNPSGLHLLNAVNLSNSVSRYKSSMSFTYENNGMQGTVNLKSILSIVAAGIRQGDTIEICSSGEDEEEALRAAIAAIKSGLGETPECFLFILSAAADLNSVSLPDSCGNDTQNTL